MSEMFCFQCQQTAGGSGCVKTGVCGKQPETAHLQDALVCRLIRLAEVCQARQEYPPEVTRLLADGLFTTLTNVNFDNEAIRAFTDRVDEALRRHGGSSGSGQHRPLPDGDGDNPSSIVDIFGSKATSIPRIQGDPGVRLACRDPQGQPLTAQEVYAKVNPSVVTVVSEQSEGASIGTGVIMTSDGYIITNAHVISGGKSCWVALDTGVTYEVNLVGFDEEEDLAVLKADPQNPLPAAEFGNSDLVQVGDTAYAIGNPLGVELRGTMTNGIISAVNRAVEVDGKTMTLLQTSAALNNGNSGGPLINEYGQVIGINTLKMSTTDSTEATVEGLGFALPISSVSFVVNDLIANGHYRGAPSLGITVTTVEKDGGGTQVQVMEVSAGSGAADAGIQAGDVILAADGQAVSVTSDLLTARRSHIIGDTVTLTILRDGQQFDVEVTLRSNRSFG